MGKSYLFSDFIEVKATDTEYIVEGVISSTNPDLVDDIVTENALRQMADMVNVAAAKGQPLPLGYEHTEHLGGTPNIVPLGNLFKAWVSDGKLFAQATLNKALKVFNEAKTAIERRDLHSFSIEYNHDPSKTHETFIDGVKRRIIDGMNNLVGVAVTGRPLNRDAAMNFAAKNLDYEKAKMDVKSEVNEMSEKKIPVEKKHDEVKPDEKAPEGGAPAPDNSEGESKPEEKNLHDKAEDLKKKKKVQVQDGKSEFEVSAEDFDLLKEFKAKKAEETETSKVQTMFKKFFQEEITKVMPSAAPILNGDKPGSSDLPNEIKQWGASIDSGSTELMYKSAAKLVDFYEDRGYEITLKGYGRGKSFVDPSNSGEEPSASWSSNKIQLKTVELKAQIEHDTGRITSGTEYFLSGPLLNDVFGPAIISHLNESNTLYGRLRKENANGRFGDTYGFRFKYTRASAGSYNESATDDPTAAIVSRNKAHIPFVWYRSVGQVSGPTMVAARGQGGIGDAFAEEARDHMEGLIQSVGTDLFDNSGPVDGMTRGGQLMALRYLVDDASTHTTLYSLTRTGGNFTTLQGNITAKASTPNPTKNDLRTAWTTVANNGASKGDLAYIMNYTQLRKILNLLDDAQRFNNTTPRAGFEGLPTFDGIPIVIDDQCTAGFIYLLDMRHTFLAIQLPPTMDELAKTGDFKKFQIKTYLALVCTAPNRNFLFTGFNTS